MRKVSIMCFILLLCVLQCSFANESQLNLPKEPKYISKNPLYFNMTFGQDGKNSMLCALDESEGTDKGYDTVYVDENMNNDFTDEKAKRLLKDNDASFDFKGPFDQNENAKYSLEIYTLSKKYRKSPIEKNQYFMWHLKVKQWSYFFINGQLELSSSAAEALKNKPVMLGGKCKWDINTRPKNNDTIISVGLKDENGCTLRTLQGRIQKELSPVLTLVKDNKVIKKKKMTFG